MGSSTAICIETPITICNYKMLFKIVIPIDKYTCKPRLYVYFVEKMQVCIHSPKIWSTEGFYFVMPIYILFDYIQHNLCIHSNTEPARIDDTREQLNKFLVVN